MKAITIQDRASYLCGLAAVLMFQGMNFDMLWQYFDAGQVMPVKALLFYALALLLMFVNSVVSRYWLHVYNTGAGLLTCATLLIF